jgi:MAGUK p55 subfamily protein 5
VLLDVFVIGSNAHEQLNRFFKITNIFDSQQGLLKLTDKMEMLELANANPNSVDKSGAFDMVTGSQQQQLPHQPSMNQMGVGSAHMFEAHQQHQHQSRLIGSQKISKHRELPVDVPDSFVGIAKQSPRYPPPKPLRQISPPVSGNNLTTFSSHPASNQSCNPNACAQQQLPAAPPIAQTTAANIVNHNASLRSSIKLKQLEKSRGGQQNGNYPVGQMQPAVNQAFELNEDEMGQMPNQQSNSYQQSANIIKQQKVLKMEQTMPDLCSIYNRLQRNLNGDFTDATGDARLLKLLAIYNTIVQTHDKKFRIPNLTSKYIQRLNSQEIQEPEIYSVSDLLQSVILMLRDEEMTSETVELLNILSKHEIEGVCSAFDRISKLFEFAKGISQDASPTASENGLQEHYPSRQQPQQHDQNMYPYPPHQMNDYDYTRDHVQMDIENNLYQNSLSPLTDVDLSDGTCTKTVRIEKNANQPLGATIKNEDGGVVIGRIICGGAAYNSGLLNEGDELVEVNGIALRGKSVNDVIDILLGIQDSITFTVISRTYKPIQRPLQEKTFVKTFFKYDGENDQYIPCKELGLSFERGEILAIIDRSDPRWWQAHREADSEWRLAGLIPSINFLKEREKESNHENPTNMYLKREKKNLVSLLFNCPKGSAPRRRKKFSNILPQEIPYYEEVSTYYPVKYHKRPIILVGPKMIGQDKIKKKLLEDPSRFASAVSHTSKPRGPDEIDGVNFHFVSRAEFEADMRAGKFIECGQFQNHYYGTSIEAMKQVVASQKFCVHSLNMPSIFHFRQGRAGSQLKPFFVFVKPDTSHPDKLRNLVASLSKSNVDESNIKAIMADVELIETYYLPYFDFVLTVSDVDRAYQELLYQIGKIENDPQWIPMFWQEVSYDDEN